MACGFCFLTLTSFLLFSCKATLAFHTVVMNLTGIQRQFMGPVLMTSLFIQPVAFEGLVMTIICPCWFLSKSFRGVCCHIYSTERISKGFKVRTAYSWTIGWETGPRISWKISFGSGRMRVSLRIQKVISLLLEKAVCSTQPFSLFRNSKMSAVCICFWSIDVCIIELFQGSGTNS